MPIHMVGGVVPYAFGTLRPPPGELVDGQVIASRTDHRPTDYNRASQARQEWLANTTTKREEEEERIRAANTAHYARLKTITSKTDDGDGLLGQPWAPPIRGPDELHELREQLEATYRARVEQQNLTHIDHMDHSHSVYDSKKDAEDAATHEVRMKLKYMPRRAARLHPGSTVATRPCRLVCP